MDRNDIHRMLSHFLQVSYHGETTEAEICDIIGEAKREALCAGLDDYLANEKVREAFLSAAERKVDIKVILNNKGSFPKWLEESQKRGLLEVRYPPNNKKVRTMIYVDERHVFMKDN